MARRTRPTHWLCGAGTGEEFEAAFAEMAASGSDIHGEARLVASFRPRSVLDAGCGTGRVARELARQGIDVVGVDISADMLAPARRNAPELDWRVGDLATIDLGRSFDIVLLAGNVMIFLEPGTEAAVIANLARHLNVDGMLITGFQLDFGFSFEEYDDLAIDAGLSPVARWSTWDREAASPTDTYAVAVHRLAGG